MSRSSKKKAAKKRKLVFFLVLIVVLAFGGLVAYAKFAKDKPLPVQIETEYTDKQVYPWQDERRENDGRPISEENAPKDTESDVPVSEEKTGDVSNEAVLEESDPVVSNDPGYLEVHFIDVGQGDSILLKYVDTIPDDGDDSAAMLVDAGDDSKGTLVRNYIKKQGVSELSYFVCTHPDADHIGGAASIVSNVPITSETVWMPDVSKDTKTYDNLINEIKNKWYSYGMPVLSQEYKLGEATFVFVAPEKEHSDVNSNSLVFKIWLGDDSFLFTGDCEEEEELELVSSSYKDILDSDVLKVGHHGSKTSSSEDFLSLVSPEIAVISCGEGNSYHHPHAAALNNLRNAGCDLYRTDIQGSIVATTYGDGIKWNASACNDWTAGE